MVCSNPTQGRDPLAKEDSSPRDWQHLEYMSQVSELLWELLNLRSTTAAMGLRVVINSMTYHEKCLLLASEMAADLGTTQKSGSSEGRIAL